MEHNCSHLSIHSFFFDMYLFIHSYLFTLFQHIYSFIYIFAHMFIRYFCKGAQRKVNMQYIQVVRIYLQQINQGDSIQFGDSIEFCDSIQVGDSIQPHGTPRRAGALRTLMANLAGDINERSHDMKVMTSVMTNVMINDMLNQKLN